MGSAPVFLIPLYSLFFYTTLACYLGLITVYVALRAVESAGNGTGFAVKLSINIAMIATKNVKNLSLVFAKLSEDVGRE